jgi:hypothetical protein
MHSMRSSWIFPLVGLLAVCYVGGGGDCFIDYCYISYFLINGFIAVYGTLLLAVGPR